MNGKGCKKLVRTNMFFFSGIRSSVQSSLLLHNYYYYYINFEPGPSFQYHLHT